jgi:hypothetical protein
MRLGHDDLGPQGAPTTPFPHPLELWCDRRCSCRGMAAFHLGRLINRLNWHLQQYLLSPDGRGRPAVIAVLDRMADSSVELAAPGELSSSAQIARLKDDLFASLQTTDAGDAWSEANATCREWDENAPDFSEGHRCAVCDDLIAQWVTPWVGNARRLATDRMNEAERHLLPLANILTKSLAPATCSATCTYFSSGRESVDIRDDEHASQAAPSSGWPTIAQSLANCLCRHTCPASWRGSAVSNLNRNRRVGFSRRNARRECGSLGRREGGC